MRLIRKYDVFKELTKYTDGELSLGDCIDNCETLNLNEIIVDLESVKKAIKDGKAKETLETVINGLKKWSWEDD
jgi:hypothetical protein